MGHKGHEMVDAGYVYAPYIPLMSCPTININFIIKNKDLIGEFILKHGKIRSLYELSVIPKHDYNNPNIPIVFGIEKYQLHRTYKVNSFKSTSRTYIGHYTWEIDGNKNTITCLGKKIEHYRQVLKKCRGILRKIGNKI